MFRLSKVCDFILFTWIYFVMCNKMFILVKHCYLLFRNLSGAKRSETYKVKQYSKTFIKGLAKIKDDMHKQRDLSTKIKWSNSTRSLLYQQSDTLQIEERYHAWQRTGKEVGDHWSVWAYIKASLDFFKHIFTSARICGLLFQLHTIFSVT